MRKMSSPTQSKSYTVGYGKPPRGTRWKPGQSGNPRGRPKGSTSLPSIFHKIMKQRVKIQERGRSIWISMWEAVARRLRQKALEGDLKAITFLTALEPEIAKKVEPPPKLRRNMTATEAQEAYDRFRQMIR